METSTVERKTPAAPPPAYAERRDSARHESWKDREAREAAERQREARS